MGFATLLLALWGIKSRWREALPWVLMAAVLIGLALGPILRVNGRLFEFPTPYRLLSPLVFVRLMRIPERFNMFLALPIGVLAALGIGSAWRRKPKAWQAVLTGGVLYGVILFEYLIVPIPMLRPSSYDTSFYRQIRSEPGDLAVVNLPFNVSEARKYMFDQTLHHRPILQGNLSRRYEGLYDYIDSNPLLRVLRRVDEMPPYLTDVSRQLAALNQDGIRYIIVHKTWVGEDRIAHWRQYLLTEPCYQDERVIIYRTAPQAGRDFALKEELVPGLGPIDVLVSADCLTLGHVLQVDVGWGSTEPIDRDLDVAISLVDGTGVAHQTERYPLSDGWPTVQWPAHAIVWGHYAFRISPSLRIGDYTVTLALLDAETGHTLGHPMALRSVTVRSDICNLAVEPGAQDVNALFGDVLRLLEYEANQEGGSLHLTLYWHLERRMDIDRLQGLYTRRRSCYRHPCGSKRLYAPPGRLSNYLLVARRDRQGPYRHTVAGYTGGHVRHCSGALRANDG